MGEIGYGYGSEWHLLRYLGYHRWYLDRFILKGMGVKTDRVSTEAWRGRIRWVDADFSSTRKPLHDDREFRGVYFKQPNSIAAVLGVEWPKYWPASGNPPHWDAVGRYNSKREFSESPAERGLDPDGEWLLVEAKAHLGEMETQCGATSSESIEMIRRALNSTAKAVTHHGVPTDAWMNKYYQYANRLATLNFLCNISAYVQPARLIFLYFYGELEEAMPGRKCPQSAAEWQAHIDMVNSEMDIDSQSPLMQRVHHITLPINLRAQPLT